MPIELRYRTYFATLRVPDDLRAKLGRSVFRQTLQTDSKRTAEQRAAPLIAQWRSQIEAARGDPNSNDATFWRDALRRAQGTGARDGHGRPADERALVLDLIEDAADRVGMVNVDQRNKV